MLRGARVHLRLTKSSDLEIFHQAASEIANRGRYYPLDLHSEVSRRHEFEKNGLWGEDFGLLLIVDTAEDRIVGHVAFFKTIRYYQGLEIGYIVFDPKDRGRGYAAEATRMFCKYLFDSRPILRLTIQCESGNFASQRIAQKCGFKLEGVARSVFESYGKPTDIEVWSLTHADIYSDPSYV